MVKRREKVMLENCKMAGENSFVRYIAKNNYRLILIYVKIKPTQSESRTFPPLKKEGFKR